jgi:hypothetical protein
MLETVDEERHDSSPLFLKAVCKRRPLKNVPVVDINSVRVRRRTSCAESHSYSVRPDAPPKRGQFSPSPPEG